MRSGAEIKVALEAFVARWRDYAGSERAEAQTFLNELFRCYGTDRVAAGRRSELCLEHDMGLTKLYNLMDDGAFTDLAALHRDLDEAVADAYGWPAAVAQDDAQLVRLLTERNRQIAEDSRPYSPFD